MSARDRTTRADDLAATMVATASDLAPCGGRVTEGRIVQSRLHDAVADPSAAITVRAVRVSELVALRRMAPQPEMIDPGLVAHGSIRVLLEGGMLVGAVGWLEQGSPVEGAPTTNGALLRALFVDAAHRRRGHGRLLLERCCAELRARRLAILDADAPVEAVPFLVRHGFRAIGPAPRRAAGTAPNGVLMTRNLAPSSAIV